MSTRERRRVGSGTATSESARRQLMQPVQCWEKVWVTPAQAASGSSLKVFKWVKTDKKQHFSDDEDEIDEPLAPLPDEPEVIEGEGEGDGDDDMDQDEPTAVVEQEVALEPISRGEDDQDPEPTEDLAPPPLSLSLPSNPSHPSEALTLQRTNIIDNPDDELDVAATFVASLDEMDEATAQALQDLPEGDLSGLDLPEGDLTGLDMEGLDVGMSMEGGLNMGILGPDGTQFEGEGDLSQMQDGDELLGGGEVMDETRDPFEMNNTGS